jgi:hypothetical protein
MAETCSTDVVNVMCELSKVAGCGLPCSSTRSNIIRYSSKGNEETQVVVDHQHRSEPSCSVLELFIVQHAKCMPKREIA